MDVDNSITVFVIRDKILVEILTDNEIDYK